MDFLELPEFYMPFPVSLNPKLDALRAHTKTWTRKTGMLGAIDAWSGARFDAADYALFSALTYPKATLDELILVNDWHIWAWFADDFFLQTVHRKPASVERFIVETASFLPLEGKPAQSPANPVQRGLSDLWARTLRQAPKWCSYRLRQQAVRFITSWTWKLENLRAQRLPDPVDYVEMRRRTGGAEMSATLVMYAARAALPDQLARSKPVRTLTDTFSDIGPLRNDIISYEKEISAEGERNNGVLVVREFLNCTLAEAVDVVNELVTARLRQFEKTTQTELPLLVATLNESSRNALQAYVDALRDWMAGDLRWATVTGRYRHERLAEEQKTAFDPQLIRQ